MFMNNCKRFYAQTNKMTIIPSHKHACTHTDTETHTHKHIHTPVINFLKQTENQNESWQMLLQRIDRYIYGERSWEEREKLIKMEVEGNRSKEKIACSIIYLPFFKSLEQTNLNKIKK